MGEAMEFEKRICNSIATIRKRRNRAGFQNILEFFNRECPKLEMKQFKDIMISMEKKNLIINKGRSDLESFYIMQDDLDASIEDNCSIPNGVDIPNYSECKQTLENFLDDQFETVLTNKIKDEVKSQMDILVNKLNIANSLSAIKNEHSDANDLLIKTLKDEISFLRSQIKSKDELIRNFTERSNDIICLRSEIREKDDLLEKRTSEINYLKNTLREKEDLVIKDNKCNVSNNPLPKEIHVSTDTKLNTSSKSISILGDSIVKHIKPHKLKHKLKNNRLYVKSFPGATVQDMQDYAKPILRKKPDTVIYHAGTNDLASKNVTETIDEIRMQLTNIKKSGIRVLASSLTVRNDKLDTKRKEVNHLLKTLCTEEDIEFIDNENVTLEHICNDGVHLNFKGVILLGNNYLNAILH